MNPGQKIFFLILSLILLMIVCVYTNLEKLSNKSFDTQATIEQTTQIEEKTKIAEESKENTQNSQKEQKSQENIEEKTKEEEPTKTKAIKKQEVEQKQEKTEDEPLITTDKRYKRTGDEKPIEQMSIDTQLLQIKIRDYVTKYPITFETSSNKVTKKSLNTISTVMKMLKNHPNLKIEIAGHTDASGTKKFNLGISIGRAVAVKNQMIKYGFDKNMIKARGYGETIPIVENSENGYSKINRRVEFNIIEE